MNRVVALVIDRRTEEVIGVGIENDIGSRSFCSMNALRKFEVTISNGRIVENEILLNSYDRVEYVYLNTNPTAIQNRDIVSARVLLSKEKITVYHGTKKINLVPMYGKGKSGNDYGVGFYTTPILNLAREWSCSSYSRGGVCYVYEYSLDISELSILDLTRVDPLHWVAEVLSNRGVDISDGEYREDIDLFLKNYKINTNCFDVIVGYRADDKYFSYIENFVSNSISIELLESAMRMGNLGLQVFIKSKRAFSKLELISCEEVDKKYESLYAKRDKKARSDYDLLRRESRSSRFGTYFVDVLRRL